MWVVVHLFAGLALGVLPLPFWALALIALASHLLLDLVPHWDYTHTAHPVVWGAADFTACLLAVVLAAAVFGAPLRLLGVGMIAAAPDADVVASGLRGGRSSSLWPGHWQHFPHGACRPLPGIATQVVVLLASGLALALA
jgi:hypothetical protein